MFRFVATLLATGVAVLAASAWWSGRDAPRRWPAIAEPTASEAAPAAEPEPAPERAPGDAPTSHAAPSARSPEPAPPRPTLAAEAARRPAMAAVPAPRPPARRVPAIPSPVPAEQAQQARVDAPEPALPEPIPAPFAPPARDDVEETRIPEPAAFEDEVFELARPGDDERYGEENVVWVEGDHGYGGRLEDLFVDAERAPSAGDDDVAAPAGDADEERAVAMSGHDASAARIRRLLDVYESLGATR